MATTLGIDIGGTNLSLGLVDDGKIVQGIHTPSFHPGMTLDETLDYLAAQIEKIFRVGTEKIGIGVPSVVDVKQGIVYDTQNIPSWTEVPLKEHLEKRFGVPVDVNNDANCFAMGVYGTYPVDSKPETLVVVTLGTGVGMGIVHEGKLFCGANCGAGELGCLPFKDGILEDYCSKKFFTGLRSHTHRPGRRYREQLSLLPSGDGRIHPRELPVSEGRRTAYPRHLYRR